MLLFQKFGFQAFCHTTQNAYRKIRVIFFLIFKLGKAHSHGLLRFFADGTRIQQNQVGFFHIKRGIVALFVQNGSHNFRIGEIHLAAVAFQKEFFGVFGLFSNCKSFALFGFVYIFFLHSLVQFKVQGIKFQKFNLNFE